MMIFKTLWAHRKQNGFIFAEIALIAILSFYLIDNTVVWLYNNYFCQAAGEIDKQHLAVAQTARSTAIPVDSLDKDMAGNSILAPLFAFTDEIRALPEVQSVCLTQNIVGDGQNHWNYHAIAPETDTTRTCSAYIEPFIVNQCYFETLGITTVKGSPAVETLSKETPTDGIVITRSLALQLFDTDDAVGRRVVDIQYKPGPDAKDTEFITHHTVYGVVNDVKPYPNERYHYVAFHPLSAFSTNTPLMLIRLKHDVNNKEFVTHHSSPVTNQPYSFGWIYTYDDYVKNFYHSDIHIFLTLFGTLGLLFALNVILGTLGTFWLQIRKRTEDFGIMRSFGAKRRHIFCMVWGEGALLTLLACMAGQIVYLQFALNLGLPDGNIRASSGQESDWVSIFWIHFLVVCTIQYLIILVVVSIGLFIPSTIAMHKHPVEALRHE